jgi:hypothetical protein
MNDEHDGNPDDAADDVTGDPDVDAEQDARIRALLAELGAGPDGEPIPAEVEARLDDTLALLIAERGRTAAGPGQVGEDDSTPGSKEGNVVPLRRRWLPRAGAAAAALIVLGVGGLAVANFGNQSGQQSSSDSAGASAPEAESKADSGAESKSGSKSGSKAGSDSSTGATQLPDLSAASFEGDVSILLQGRASKLTSEGDAEGDGGDEPSPNNRENALPGAPGVLPSRACPGPEVTDGAAARQVLYDGKRAVLLVHPERGGRLLVEAWNCDGDRRLATTKIKP